MESWQDQAMARAEFNWAGASLKMAQNKLILTGGTSQGQREEQPKKGSSMKAKERRVCLEGWSSPWNTTEGV